MLENIFPFLKSINDLTNTHYPYYILLKREILENHRFPIFNPLIFGGMNLLGDPQSGIFYPFTYLYLFLNFNFATILILLSHFCILFIGTYLIFRKILNSPKIIGIVMGLLFMLLPKWSYHVVAGHLSLIESLTWFPIIFYFILKITRKDYILSKKDLILFIIFCCLSIFANYFFFYQISLFVGVYLLLWLFSKIKNKKYSQIKPALKFVVASWIIIFFVTSIQIVPGLTKMQNLTHADLGKIGTIPFWSWKYLFQGLFFPYGNLVKFDQEAFMYSGVLFYILAVVGIFFGSDRPVACHYTNKNKKIFIVLIIFFLIFIVNYKFPFYETFINFIPGASTLRVTTRFWFFIDFILLIFMYQCVNALIHSKKTIFLIVGAILAEYIFIGVVKLNSPSTFGDQKETAIYKYLASNYQNQKIYTTSAFLSQFFTAKYDIHLAAGENPWQDRGYINLLKKAGGYSWFNDYAVIYPPWAAAKAKAQPDSKLLGELNVRVVLSSYSLRDKSFKYIREVDTIKVYENNF
jgi:hypothetical protein